MADDPVPGEPTAGDPDDVLELFLGFWIARGVMAAVELGVFEALEGTALGLEEAQAALGLPERPTRALLDTCAATGLLDKADGRWTNSAKASKYLHAGSQHSLRNYVLDERWCWGPWARLEDSLRADAQMLPADEDGYHDFPEDFFLDFLHGHTLAMGERLAEVIDLSNVGRIMDVGGGSGAVSIALARQFPGLRAVVVDQGPVLAKTAGHIHRAGLDQRISTQAANIFGGDLPADCDAAIVANVLHDFSPERARQILAGVAAALPPGGRLVIMEITPNAERTGPPLAVAFALAMIVNTAGGDAHTEAQYRQWMADAGFVDVISRPLPGRMVTLSLEGRKGQ